MTALLATVGPATGDRATMTALIRLGVGGLRFSASKFGPAQLAAQAADALAASRAAGRPVELLLDLPGVKTRFTNTRPLDLAAVRRFRVVHGARPAREGGEVPELGLSAPQWGRRLARGDVLLLGDGEDAARVVSVAADHCVAEPLTGGVLGPRKGVCVQGGGPRGSGAAAPADLALLERLAHAPFTGAVVSFAESAADLAPVRAAWGGRGANAVVAKVETVAGAAAVAEVARAADSVLLGRGDLLLDAGAVEFPGLCAHVVRECARLSVPVVVGTQLLAGLENSWLPHRSELAHLCELLESGVDGLLLATETTIGADPLRTVSLLAELARRYGTPAAGRRQVRG
ncbi:pyruvate kinase [Streptomyces sp. NPDC004111]|uniref:pyruvate kinase n=1 Tax=Streptomyces sp. NPDC004111 TaxID=3364690 RepID=UPI0036A02F6F